jgi:tRNA(Ser,Leu) C12 N-acetylase TAN1
VDASTNTQVPWNVVVTAQPGAYRRARRRLGRLEELHPTPFYNVLVMCVEDEDWEALLDELHVDGEPDPLFRGCLARVAPAQFVFDFDTAEAFLAQAEEAMRRLASELAGSTFHVRFHRRGLPKAELPTIEVERRLAAIITELTGVAGEPAIVRFEDPDAIVAVDTVGHRAGVALWKRAQLHSYPLLHLD